MDCSRVNVLGSINCPRACRGGAPGPVPCPMQTAAFSFASGVNPTTAEMPTSSLSLEDTTGTELPAKLAVGGIVGEMSAPSVIPFTGPSHAEDELPLPVILPFTGADSDDFHVDEVL